MSDYYDYILVHHSAQLAAQLLAEECRRKDVDMSGVVDMIHSLSESLARRGIKVKVWPETLEYRIEEP